MLNLNLRSCDDDYRTMRELLFLTILLSFSSAVYAEGKALYSVDGSKDLQAVDASTGANRFIKTDKEVRSGSASQGGYYVGNSWVASSEVTSNAKKFPKKSGGGDTWGSHFHGKRDSPGTRSNVRVKSGCGR